MIILVPKMNLKNLHTMFTPLPKFLITLGLLAYAVIVRCLEKGKKLIKRCCCCCWCISQFIFNSSSFGIHFNTQSVFNSLFDSFWFVWFHLRFAFVRSIIHLINWVIFVTSLYTVKLEFVCRSLYTWFKFIAWIYCAPAAWFRIYCVLIVLPVEVAIETHNETTPTSQFSSVQKCLLLIA